MYSYIIQTLCEAGCKAYLTGGAVRDFFLGYDPLDYDIVTEAIPEQIETLFKDHKVNKVGKSFEVCLVNGIEVAGYRKDTYFGLSDKNCEIEPALTLEEDLGRRDLTINAMAFCPYTGELIDPYSGLDDLKHRMIHFVGDPTDRIYEDPCRIIRACRFLSKIDGEFTPSTKQALIDNAHFVPKYITPERIRKEIIKALSKKKASRFFQALDEIGALQYIFPALSNCHEDGGQYHSETIFEHCMFTGDGISTRRWMTKLAGYLHDVGKPICRNPDGSFTGHADEGANLVGDMLHKLRFSAFEINHIVSLIELHMRDVKTAKGKGIRKALAVFNECNISYQDWLRLKFADATGNLTKGPYLLSQKKDMVNKFEKELHKENPVFCVTDLSITGHDIMKELGLQPGPEVGGVLRKAYELVLEYPDMNDREELISWLQQFKS